MTSNKPSKSNDIKNIMRYKYADKEECQSKSISLLVLAEGEIYVIEHCLLEGFAQWQNIQQNAAEALFRACSRVCTRTNEHNVNKIITKS